MILYQWSNEVYKITTHDNVTMYPVTSKQSHVTPPALRLTLCIIT